MKDHIERDAAKEAVCTVILHDGIRDALKSCIDDVPAADVRPVVRGEWIDYQQGRWVYAQCPFCETVHDVKSNFCPNCGAELRGDDK